ncbi:hypothetical protein [Myxococcus sp. AM010]|uniref:hypothetical protein n=1 Tax=Myxococcus sp. AM010 TaxID=2745138 RepID=UPI00159593CC|nr:hypothetical protein [Myxococcus sp. AM010]NVJ13520.1 hypothetical protein [Myxococcus sp. AM010]
MKAGDVNESRLSLSGLGLITTLGYSVEEACAALRCGMARPAPVEGMTTWDVDVAQDLPLIGHPISVLTDGYQGVGRWFRLGQYALLDLLRYANLDSEDTAFWRACGFVVCLPTLDPERFNFRDDLARAMPQRLLHALRLPVDAQHCVCIEAGPVGPLMALQIARKKFATGSWHRAVILSLDSLVDEASLKWLAAQGRLKTPGHPVGLMGGEAGACILVEAPRQSGSREEAWVDACFVEESPGKHLPAVHWGQTLAGVIQQALAGGTRIGDVFGNLNGEVRRAMAWGTARVRIDEGALLPSTRETWLATSLGDVGTSAALVAICMATRAYARGYARGDASLVWSLSDEGASGACIVRRPIQR